MKQVKEPFNIFNKRGGKLLAVIAADGYPSAAFQYVMCRFPGRPSRTWARQTGAVGHPGRFVAMRWDVQVFVQMGKPFYIAGRKVKTPVLREEDGQC